MAGRTAQIWNGINLDYWAQTQTMHPPQTMQSYWNGDSPIDIGPKWWHFIEKIPLAVRYASFCDRLKRATDGR